MRGDLPIPGSTRARLLDVALTLFATRPYEQVDVKVIAAEAGVTIGALYHHFGSKHELYQLLRDEMLARLTDRIEAATESIPDQEKFRTGVEAAFTGMLKIQVGYLLTAASPAELTTTERPDRLTEVLGSLAAESGVSEPHLTAHFLTSSIRTAVQYVSRHPESREAVRRVLLTLLPN